METMEKTNQYIDKKISGPRLINNNNEVEIRLLNFQETGSLYLMQLWVNNLQNNNYCIFLKDQYLNLVISEVKEIMKPVYHPNFNWRHTNHVFYEVMKSVEFWLPGDNFYLIKHFFVPEEKLLSIFLGKSEME